MRIFSSIVVAALAACGTKKNPEACCIDDLDCAAVGLPVGSTCDDGLSCRNHRCVELPCKSSSECDPLSPYCIGNDACEASCMLDEECPGFGQGASQRFCETGACVECRAATTDCEGATPVCDAGACRRCELNSECDSGVCTEDGSCEAETGIAYVATNGSPAAPCTRSEPCTFARALETGINRRYLVLASGSYTFAGTQTLQGLRSIIGEVSGRPVLANTMTGPVFTLGSGADITFDNVEVRGATNTGSLLDGNGIECPSNFQKSSLRVLRSVFTQNALAGVLARQCNLEVRESSFVANGRGLEAVDVMGTVERSTFALNLETGMYLDAGLYTVTNNFVYRNPVGVELAPTTAGTTFAFNTVVDNATRGISCSSFTGQFEFPHNLVARNGVNVDSQDSCSFAASMVLDSDIAPLKFKSPDTMPYDYHLTPGSIALDQISTATQVRDFDGEIRPYGAGHDYGADELH